VSQVSQVNCSTCAEASSTSTRCRSASRSRATSTTSTSSGVDLPSRPPTARTLTCTQLQSILVLARIACAQCTDARCCWRCDPSVCLSNRHDSKQKYMSRSICRFGGMDRRNHVLDGFTTPREGAPLGNTCQLIALSA